MFMFGKFKTSFNVNNGRKKRGKQEEVSYGMTVTGAYRVNRNEFSIDGNYSDSQGKIKRTTRVPPTVTSQQQSGSLPPRKRAPNPPLIPPQEQPEALRLTKSTSDLIKDKNLPPTIRQAQSGVSLDPRGASDARRNSKVAVDPTNNKRQLDAHKRVEKKRLEEQKKLEKQRLEEEKKLEKQRLEEQKKREKLALQEEARQEKLRKEREKKDKKTKRAAPPRPLANPLAQSTSQAANNQPNQSTNTLNSSISKTSGPPPYSEDSNQERRENDNKSDVKFSKPVDEGSWDMVSQHRQNVIVNRPAKPTQPVKGQTTIDLNYTLGDSKSDA